MEQGPKLAAHAYTNRHALAHAHEQAHTWKVVAWNVSASLSQLMVLLPLLPALLLLLSPGVHGMITPSQAGSEACTGLHMEGKEKGTCGGLTVMYSRGTSPSC